MTGGINLEWCRPARGRVSSAPGDEGRRNWGDSAPVVSDAASASSCVNASCPTTIGCPPPSISSQRSFNFGFHADVSQSTIRCRPL